MAVWARARLPSGTARRLACLATIRVSESCRRAVVTAWTSEASGAHSRVLPQCQLRRSRVASSLRHQQSLQRPATACTVTGELSGTHGLRRRRRAEARVVLVWLLHGPGCVSLRQHHSASARDVEATDANAAAPEQRLANEFMYKKQIPRRIIPNDTRSSGHALQVRRSSCHTRCRRTEYLPAKRAGPRRARNRVFNQIVTIPEAAATQQGWCPEEALCLVDTQEGALPGEPQHFPAAASAKVPFVLPHRSLSEVTALSAREAGKDGRSHKSQNSERSALFMACKVLSTQDLCHALRSCWV